MKTPAYTLIELLVVIAIIGLLAAILFPVFSRAKLSAKNADCIANLKQTGLALSIYLSDFDDRYPQTRLSNPNPEVDDASGELEEPILGHVFDLLAPYIEKTAGPHADPLLVCPVDPDPFGNVCLAENPDVSPLNSYLVNASFIFGLNGSGVGAPSNTIYVAERRSGSDPYCDDVYHPWFNASNPQAPEDEMDALNGAVATTRHFEHSNFQFCDAHVKGFVWSATYSPPTVDMHVP